jgi:hypothetical protein
MIPQKSFLTPRSTSAPCRLWKKCAKPSYQSIRKEWSNLRSGFFITRRISYFSLNFDTQFKLRGVQHYQRWRNHIGLQQNFRRRNVCSICSLVERSKICSFLTKLTSVNQILGILHRYWCYKAHSFSIAEIQWIDCPLGALDYVSRAINVMFIFSVVHREASQTTWQPDIVNGQEQKLLDCLHEALLNAFGYGDVRTISMKRNGYDENPSNREERIKHRE